MGALNQHIIIERPIETVFAWTTDMERAPEIMDHVEKTEKITEGPVGKGTQYNEIRNVGNRRVQTTLEVIEYIPNTSYAVLSDQNGVQISFRYEFTPQGNETHVTFNGDIKTRGLARTLFKGMIVRMIAKEELLHLSNLKKYIEKNTEGK
ncbi:SRPBCC family protein [Jeotgalibacillus soli]|uniref:Polyketide cyclase / dehydrase and lipid transport n=1 Tax=Jeotgalibacillus soli TaxID=889306 RepID=A0A0C2VL24_9BACL|nr:SRPBCC family protein [Jeotgalibacillus soli]KIL49587.1 hypothetical protein KP78_10550 [Jeotgalibacillus soli]